MSLIPSGKNVRLWHKEVIMIDYCTFEGCSSLTSVTLPDKLKYIERFSFDDCISLSSVTIPNSVTSIGFAAFQGCKALNSISIGNSVATIDASAFQNCTNITSITSFCQTPPVIYENTFSNKTCTNAKLLVPQGSKNLYSSYLHWDKFNTIVEFDATSINDVINDYSQMPMSINTIHGIKVRSNVDRVKSLPKGIYIINGKKVIIK